MMMLSGGVTSSFIYFCFFCTFLRSSPDRRSDFFVFAPLFLPFCCVPDSFLFNCLTSFSLSFSPSEIHKYKYRTEKHHRNPSQRIQDKHGRQVQHPVASQCVTDKTKIQRKIQCRRQTQRHIYSTHNKNQKTFLCFSFSKWISFLLISGKTNDAPLSAAKSSKTKIRDKNYSYFLVSCIDRQQIT